MIIPEEMEQREEERIARVSWSVEIELDADLMLASAAECYELDINTDRIKTFEDLVKDYPMFDWAEFLEFYTNGYYTERVTPFEVVTKTV